MKGKTKLRTMYSLFVVLVMAVACLGFTSIPTKSAQAEGSSITLEGDGSESNPYLISTLEELEFFRDDVNGGNNYALKKVKLTADINLNGKSWTPIGNGDNPFNGMFDGDNYTISNLVINGQKEYATGATYYAGLFGYMKGGATAGIKNLTVENADITACLYVGAILGRSYIGGIIENCHVKGNIKVDAYSYAGIIVGRHDYSAGNNVNGEKMSIYNCSVEGTTKTATVNCDYAVSYAGGIVGFLAEGEYAFGELTVKNAKITGTYGIGGISGIGHYGNTFKNVSVEKVSVISANNDPESARSGNVGLIVGACQGTENQKTVFKGYDIEQSKTQVNGEEFKSVFGNNISGQNGVTNFVVKVNDYDYYETVAEATANVKADDKVTLIAETTEDIQLPAGVKLDTNGFSAPNVTVEALPIEDVLVERNAENNATIITIIYSNSKKVTTFTVYDGKDGKNGQDGQDGTNGNNGINGKDGTNGVNGVNGKDGLGIKTAEINDNGELLITYTDDTKENLGVIVGANGQNGINGTDGKDGGIGLAMTAIIIGGIAIFLSITLLILFFFKGAQV